MSKVENRVSVGGQALIEGILMRGPKCSAMALRLPDGSISVEEKKVIPITKKYKKLNVPIIRGVASFIDSMVFGYKCMMESAEKTSFEEIMNDDGEEEMSKLDRWLTDHFGPKMVAAITVIAVVLGIALSVFLFMWLPAFIFDLINKATGESIGNFRGIIEGVMRLAIFIGYMFIVSRMKDIKRVFMYHGAEHKSIFCFEQGLELTVDNVREQSRFHPRCGTSFMIVMIVISILISSLVSIIFPAVTKIRLVWVLIKIFIILPIVMGLGYEFIKYAGTHENKWVRILSAPGLWMQRITTVEPTDDIIEVGIASLKAALWGVDSDGKEIADEEETQEEAFSEYDELSPFENEKNNEEAIGENSDEPQSVDDIMAELMEKTSFNEEI